VNEFLAAETGVHGHDANQINHIQQVFYCAGRCAWVQRNAGLGPCRTYRLHGAVNMWAGLNMGRNDIRTGLGEGFNIRIDRRDHQVNVHDGLDMGPDRSASGRAKCDIRHEMPVHYVHMNPISTLCFDFLALSSEIGEISGQDRRGNFDGTVKSHGVIPLILFPSIAGRSEMSRPGSEIGLFGTK